MKPNPPHGGYPTPREDAKGPYDDIVRAAKVPTVTRAEAERYWSLPPTTLNANGSPKAREALLELIDELRPGNELVVRCRTTGTTVLVRPTAEVVGR